MLGRIHATRRDLRPSEGKLADYVLAHAAEVVGMPMADLARRVGVSEPTVARFCAALGCGGFKEFKIKLAQDIAAGRPFLTEAILPGEAAAGILGKVCDRVIQVVGRTRDNASAEALERAVALLATAGRIEFYGSGNSGTIAEDIQRRFFRLGMATVAYADPHVYFVSALSLGPGDGVVVVSHSGQTREILEACDNALSVGAAVVALTRPGSPLAKRATVALAADGEEAFDVFTPMTARFAHLVLGDALAMAVAARRGR